MKQINKYICDHFENDKFSILERLHINKDTGNHHYNYHPKTKDELKQLVDKLVKERGNDADLNDIDTSKITNMYGLFYKSFFNGDISKWDVSNVEDMRYMFCYSEFTGENGYISKWDVSNVKDMMYMFCGTEFTGENGDISNWDVSKVENMDSMFEYSSFNGDISKWDVSNVKDIEYMFYKSKFTAKNGDISKWDVSNVENMNNMFKGTSLEKNPPKWYKH